MPSSSRRYHRRSLTSRIRKWMGLPSRHRHAHRRPVSQEEVNIFQNSVTEQEIQHSNPGESSHSSVRRSRHRRKQRLRSPLARFFAGKPSTRQSRPLFNQWDQFRKFLGLHGKSKPPKPELFYKRAEDGSYKVIEVRARNTYDIKNSNPPSKVPVGQESYTYHSRNSSNANSFKQLIRKVNKLFKGKQNYYRHHRHHSVESGERIGTSTAHQQNANVSPHIHHHFHQHTGIKELFVSWLNLGFVIKLVSSACLFITAYIITWLTYSFTSIFVASFSGISGVLYYYEVMWPDGVSSTLLNHSNAVAVALAGPIISLFMTALYFVILISVRNLGTQLKTLLTWLFVLSMIHFLGSVVAGLITWKGIGFEISEIYLPVLLRLLISLACIVLIVWIGWKYSRFFLEIRPIRKHRNNIPLILINRMVLPGILGILFLLLVKIPDEAPQHQGIWLHDSIMLATALFFLIPPVFNRKLRPQQRALRNHSSSTIRARALVATVISILVILAYRLGLSSGLYIYMKFVFHMSYYS
jgi:hypothetical protein